MTMHFTKTKGWSWSWVTAIALTAGSAMSALAAPSAEDRALWDSYCNADGSVEQDSADLPKPNYSNPLVKGVVAKLNAIDNFNIADAHSQRTFYFYGDIEKVYGVDSAANGDKPAGTPSNVNAVSAAYVTIVCGEFRDNVKMLERKLKWAKDIVVVPESAQGYDAHKGVWEQMTGEGYRKLVQVSEALYQARASELGASASSNLDLDQKSVDGITGCEYRYILKNYLAGDAELQAWDNGKSYGEYKKGLAEFVAGNECTQDEKDYYNEFRGDGNFKAESGESNGFIWNTRIYAKGCKDPNTHLEGKGNILTDADCKNYFKAPWQSRSDLTQQGAMRMFFYPSTPELERIMKDTGNSLVIITEDLNGDGVADMVTFDGNKAGGKAVLELRETAKQPGGAGTAARKQVAAYILKAASEQVKLAPAYKTALDAIKPGSVTSTQGIKIITDTHAAWKKSYMSTADKGFAKVFPDAKKAWDRLAVVLDRHTDWYQIDMANLKIGFYQPTYSPWLASSYYIHESDNFTRPGYAMGTPGDGHRHWMYIQRVRKPDWF
ncbi:MAG TPA: hypothetical protein VL588_12965, partial [Bdellovibrionota bacterium]|nr:hypothetical protein [Bdellovibrionota bacterium]